MTNLRFIFHSGKNPKFIYYGANYLSMIIPNMFYRHCLYRKLEKARERFDWEYIQERVNYYNKLSSHTTINENSPTIEHQYKPKQKVYYLDTRKTLRWFAKDKHYLLESGDVTYIPKSPSFLKSRPIKGCNANCILLKLDRVRHFIFLKDKVKWEDKSNQVIFRGKTTGKNNRLRFMRMFYGNPNFDVGDISKDSENPAWMTPKKSLYDHLHYKFIMALEGNDVASNLKWIMGSNSVAVMPEPTYETWFMEGKLIPNYHYICIKPDFSDLEERIDYYINHPDEAKAISMHANEYVKQFFDTEREEIIELLVARKYFDYVDIKNPNL